MRLLRQNAWKLIGLYAELNQILHSPEHLPYMLWRHFVVQQKKLGRTDHTMWYFHAAFKLFDQEVKSTLDFWQITQSFCPVLADIFFFFLGQNVGKYLCIAEMN